MNLSVNKASKWANENGGKIMQKISRLVILGIFGIVCLTMSVSAQEPDYMRSEPAERNIRPSLDNDSPMLEVDVVRTNESRRREAELVEELSRLNRKAEEFAPDTPDGRKLREKIDLLSRKLRKVRVGSQRQMRQQRSHKPAPPRGRQQLKVFPLEHVPAEHAMEIVEPFAGKDAIVIGDPWANILLIRTQPQFFRDVEDIIRYIDVPERRPERTMGCCQREREGPEHPRRPEWDERERQGPPRRPEWDEREKHEQGRWEPPRRPEWDERERQGPPRRQEWAEREHRPTMRLFIQEADDGAEIFFKERPISLEQLQKQFQHLDDPHKWALSIRVRGEAPDELLEKIHRMAREKGIEKIEVEALKERRRVEHQERPVIEISVQASDDVEKGVEILFREEPISLEQLQEQLQRIDNPRESVLKIFIRRGIDDESLEKIIDEIEEIAREKGIKEIKLED